MRKLLLISITLLLLIPIAGAYHQVDCRQVKHITYNVPSGNVIFGVYANDNPFRNYWNNQTFVMDAFGKTYTLEVDSRAEGFAGAWIFHR